MRHRHNGKYRSRTPRGRITYKLKPIHSQKDNKAKYMARRDKIRFRKRHMTYKQLRKRYKIHPLADDDKDKVRNYKDCRPWDKSKHGIWFGEPEEPESYGEYLERMKEERKKKEEEPLSQDHEFVEQLAFETAKGIHKSRLEEE
jgi:hypothetical protein